MTTGNQSPWDDERVTAYVMKELSPSDRSLFEQEMANEEALADAVERAKSVTDQLSTLFAAEETPGLSKRHRAAIINEPVITRLEDEPRGRTALIAFLAIAACALAVIGLAPLMQKHSMTTLSKVTATDRSAIRTQSNSHGSTVPDDDVEEAIRSQPADRKAFEAMLAKENAYRESRKGEPLAWNPYEVPAPAAASVPSPESSSATSTITKADLVQNRNRLQRSALHKSQPRENAAVVGQVAPSVRERQRQEASPLEYQDAWEVTSGLGGRNPIIESPAGRPEASTKRRDLRRRVHSSSMKVSEVAQSSFDPYADSAEGFGFRQSGDRFEPIIENGFTRVADHPLSTFSADVDTASYSKVRDYLLRAQQCPPPDAVRIEEMINYFDYADDPPADDADHPFAAGVTITECPWKPEHRLARIAIKGKTLKPKQRPDCNLVFLLDTSGSMNADNKLPLVIDGMRMLTNQLTKNDRVAIVVYAGSAGLVLESTSAKQKKKIRRALNQLSAGGSTNGGQGITLAYQTAREHFIEGGVNRIILCTDGDFNVGTTGTDSLVRMLEKEAKDNVFLTVLGFGMGNHNDAMLEKISGRGNGNYAFIDTPKEARKVLVKQAAGTLVTIAKDVKLQVDFNPARVGAYRLIGYENRRLATQDFNDDTKDAGEIGAGHSVTALYELVPPDRVDQVIQPAVDKSKYAATDAVKPKKKQTPSQETLTVRIRYKQPDSDTSTRVDFPATDDGQSFEDADVDARFTAAVAGLGMLLRGSQHSGVWEYSDVIETAKSALGRDLEEQRAEFLQMAQQAKRLSGN